MADTFTNNLNLTKPDVGASTDTWGGKIKTDLDSLDAIFAANGTEVNIRFASANFDDNKKAIFGSTDNLEIYYSGATNIIRGLSKVAIQSDDTTDGVEIGSHSGSEVMAKFVKDGAVSLYHDNSVKLATASGGVDITGNITVSGTVDGRDVATDGSKLDGIATGATNTAAPFYTAAITSSDVTGALGFTPYSDANPSGYTTYTANQALDTTSNPTFNQIYANDWFRVNGADGIYWQTYGGGWTMNDSTWIRNYGSKALYMNAQIACTSNITAYYSDERLKEIVGNIDNPLDKILKLKGFQYVNNDLAKSFGYTDEKEQIGISAQAVQEIMPEVVSLAPFDMETKDDGSIVSMSGENYLTVDYAKLVPLLIEGIKELKKEIDELKSKEA